MNDRKFAKEFVKVTKRMSSLFVGLGHEQKLFSLYCNYTETVWGKDPLGRPVPRDEFRTQHLINLAIDYNEANEKAKKFCEEMRVSKILYLTKEPTHQNPYEYRTEEEIKAEKIWAERWAKICGDVTWVQKMSSRWNWNDHIKMKDLFKQALSKKYSCKTDEEKKQLYKQAKSLPVNLGCWRLGAIQEAKASKFVGNIGDKVELELTHTRFAGYESQFGYVNIYTFKDEKGNIFIYKGTTDLKDKDYNYVEKGDTIKVTGFIKEHMKYAPKSFDKCVLKQTRLQRLKVTEVTKQSA